MKECIEEPTGICIHHSATADSDSCSATAIRRWQMNNGFDEIAYTLIVEKVDGIDRIYTGRPSFLQGAHEPKLNRTHLSICVVGDYDKTQIGDPLLLAVVRACIGLMVLNPQIKPRDIVFHSDFSHKTCPGALFPREKLLNAVVVAHCLLFGEFLDMRESLLLDDTDE